MNIIPVKEIYCACCNLPIKDFIQHFFDENDKIICFNCFMKQNPEIDHNNQIANTLFKMGPAIERIGVLIEKRKLK